MSISGAAVISIPPLWMLRWRGKPSIRAQNSSQRSQLVLDAYDNAYVVMPYGRIVAASASSSWTDWTVLYDGTSTLNAFGEVVVDHSRVSIDGVLSFMYQETSSGTTTPSPLHVIDFQLPV